MDNYENNLPAIQQQPSAIVQIEQARAVQEVQARLIIAKRFPRDEIAVHARIMRTCQRPSFAEKAIYKLPRGGQSVTGPSINLARGIASHFGNVSSGIRIISQSEEMTHGQAFAMDLETMTEKTRDFFVRHERKAHGEIKKVTDPQQISEMFAAAGSKAERQCLLAIIPSDYVEDAMNACRATIERGGGVPLADRIRKMVTSFSFEFQVTQEQIEAYIGHKAAAMTAQEFADLVQVYNALKEDISKREDYFPIPNAGTDDPKQSVMGAGDIPFDQSKNSNRGTRTKRTNSPVMEAEAQSVGAQSSPSSTMQRGSADASVSSPLAENKGARLRLNQELGKEYKPEIKSRLEAMNGWTLTEDDGRRIGQWILEAKQGVFTEWDEAIAARSAR